MERSSFIRLTGLATFGLMAGGNLFASAPKIRKPQLIEIKPPKLHVRHGFLNLQSDNQKGLHIQRDVFNKNGLQTISEDRMVSIKISDENKETFGIKDKIGFESKSKNFSALQLRANSTTSIKVDSPSLLFSEFGGLTINGILVENNRAFYQKSKGEVTIFTKTNQCVFVYKYEH